MTVHAWFDLVMITAALFNLCTVFWLLGQKRYWKAFARQMENRMIEARERAGGLERALDALRRALHLIELDRDGLEVVDGAVISKRGPANDA